MCSLASNGQKGSCDGTCTSPPWLSPARSDVSDEACCSIPALMCRGTVSRSGQLCQPGSHTTFVSATPGSWAGRTQAPSLETEPSAVSAHAGRLAFTMLPVSQATPLQYSKDTTMLPMPKFFIACCSATVWAPINMVAIAPGTEPMPCGPALPLLPLIGAGPQATK